MIHLFTIDWNMTDRAVICQEAIGFSNRSSDDTYTSPYIAMSSSPPSLPKFALPTVEYKSTEFKLRIRECYPIPVAFGLYYLYLYKF